MGKVTDRIVPEKNSGFSGSGAGEPNVGQLHANCIVTDRPDLTVLWCASNMAAYDYGKRKDFYAGGTITAHGSIEPDPIDSLILKVD